MPLNWLKPNMASEWMELYANFYVKYSKVKMSFDVICLATTALITFIGIGRIKGLGIGTVLAAFTMGKVIGIIGEKLDKHFRFVTFRTARN